ncbi:phytanoyl-CoA dioxygenase family protein [Phenylobacterium sp.]|uniref:phytanoyl-CoA dioxygenase family protein n=1 Tax=Phenylobacterium sp. TaxID=1871053 RepID=UPI0011FD1CEC|nr:phytanoyl-CoA dioxygenase family protein [Phenylobacterium sp.]THD63497.1 MAG: phytanoyl-CoA dioxygenase [Phenylobacterium sp.]
MSLPDVPWFESDGLDAYLARAGLDADAEVFVRDLARDGYAVVDLGEAARALCDQAVAETEAYFDAGAVRVQDAWRRSPAVRRLAVWPAMRERLRAAYGRDPFPFQTLNFRRGSTQALHADTVHFHSVPARFMCGVWIALEDVRPDAGPLVYYPGSHRLPVMTMRDAGVNAGRAQPDDYALHFEPRFAERIDGAGLPRRQAELKKGQALVWAANLAHGGAPILDPDSTRRSLVVHCYFEDCLYYTPMSSDEAAGDLDLRMPPNVRTGRWAWPKRNGWPAPLAPILVARAVLAGVRRQPFVD